MGRPRLHDEQTAEALLDAAESIVAAGGPDALSVRRVAEQASTTTRAVYSLFESKEGLLVALGNRAFEILGSWVAEMSWTEDSSADLVNAAVSNFRRWALEHPALFRIAFQRNEIPPELAERFRPTQLKALADLVEIVSRALGLQGGLANPEVREATMKFDAMCEGLALLELRGVLPPDRAEQIWREALAALVSGMQMQRPDGRPAHA
jgi:AcrR family transcriptional regulator